MALVFLMAISLSMDAFSLALVYGTLKMEFKERIVLSFIVGLFHFFMPLLGMCFFNILFSFFNFDMDYVVSFILCFIGFDMFISSFKKSEVVSSFNFKDYFLFGFVVSVDSFSVGITLNNVFSPFVFACFSFIFTFTGLCLGNKIERLFGKVATILGGAVLFLIGIVYAF